MKELLMRLKLIDRMTTTLEISRVDFLSGLSEITDEASTGMMSVAFDVFSSSKSEFKGHIGLNSFEIRRRRRVFDTNLSFAVASGTFNESNGQLVVETEVNGFNNFFIFFYVCLVVFYLIFLGELFSGDTKDGIIVIPILLLHATFMFAMPYLIMRRGVKRLKYELEREFFYLTKSKKI